MEILFFLIIGHFVADYPLQGDFLARGKNHKAPLAGVPWYQCLVAHACIQGGMVALITGNPWLGVVEIGAHALIDFSKSDGKLTFNQDQALHLVCKLAYAGLIVMGVA